MGCGAEWLHLLPLLLTLRELMGMKKTTKTKHLLLNLLSRLLFLWEIVEKEPLHPTGK